MIPTIACSTVRPLRSHDKNPATAGTPTSVHRPVSSRASRNVHHCASDVAYPRTVFGDHRYRCASNHCSTTPTVRYSPSTTVQVRGPPEGRAAKACATPLPSPLVVEPPAITPQQRGRDGQWHYVADSDDSCSGPIDNTQPSGKPMSP